MDLQKRKNLRKLFTEQKTMPELFQSIPASVFEWIAVIFLCILAAAPVWTAFPMYEEGGDLSVQTQRAIMFSSVNNSVGFTGLFMGVFLLPWTYYNLPRKPIRERIRGHGLPLFLLAMLFWSCLSCAFSTNPSLSFWGDTYRQDGLISYFSYAGMFILATQVKRKKPVRIVLNVMTAVAALLALFCLLNIQVVNELFFIRADTAVFSNANHYGYYLSMMLPSAVWLFMDAKGKRRILYALEMGLLSNSLIKCHSLGPLLAVVVAMTAFLIITFIRCRDKFRMAVFAYILIFVILGVSSVNTWNIGADLGRTADDTKIIVKNMWETVDEETKEALNSVGSKRGVLWINALRFIKERPIFGYGPDNLGGVYYAAGCTNDRPHNELLQFAASLGIPAMVFYVCGLACLLLLFIRKFKQLTTWEICSYVVIGSYLISSLFGNTMYYTTPFYFTLLGLCFSQISQVEL